MKGAGGVILGIYAVMRFEFAGRCGYLLNNRPSTNLMTESL